MQVSFPAPIYRNIFLLNLFHSILPALHLVDLLKKKTEKKTLLNSAFTGISVVYSWGGGAKEPSLLAVTEKASVPTIQNPKWKYQ